MWRFAAAGCAAFVLMLTTLARADQNPTFSGPQSAAETAFVQSIQVDLNKRFATTAEAENAGYVRYTNEDDTGAISYANRQWVSKDAKHPSQLWYDAKGNLLGADFSVLAVNGTRPTLWGINPGRWYQFDTHMHWVAKDPATESSPMTTTWRPQGSSQREATRNRRAPKRS